MTNGHHGRVRSKGTSATPRPRQTRRCRRARPTCALGGWSQFIGDAAPGVNGLLDLVEEPHEGFLPGGIMTHVEEDWLPAQDFAANLIDPGNKLVLACHNQRCHMKSLEEVRSNIVLPAAPKVRSPNMDTRRWLTVASHGF